MSHTLNQSLDLAPRFKKIHSTFTEKLTSLQSDVENLKTSMSVFYDFGQQCIELEEKFNDTLQQKELILSQYLVLKSKAKKKCVKCSLMKDVLDQEAKKLKQYENKMKHIAQLLLPTDSGHCQPADYDKLKDICEQPPDSSEKVNEYSQVTEDQQERKNGSVSKISPNETSKVGLEPSSRVVVNEEEDDEYFETTIKRKKPKDGLTCFEIPETICDDYINFDSSDGVTDENSPTKQTPNKKRKRSPRITPELSQSRNKNNKRVMIMKERNTDCVDKSPCLLVNMKLKSTDINKVKVAVNETEINEHKKINSNENCKTLTAVDNDQSVKIATEGNKQDTDHDETKLTTIERRESETSNKDKKMSKVWTLVSSDDDEDDFSIKQPINKSNVTNTSFTKPDANKWKLKVLNSSFNKEKLKQTKLTLQKNVNKIDLADLDVDEHNFNDEIGDILVQEEKTRDTKLATNERKLIIEETQQSEEEDFVEEASKIQSGNNDMCIKKSTNTCSDPQECDFTLPNESMFLPNAVSTQNKPNIEENMNLADLGDIKSTPNVDSSTSNRTSTIKDKTNMPAPRSKHSKVRSKLQTSNSMSRDSKLGESSFIPSSSVSKYQRKDGTCDFSSKWICPGCIDYFTDSYGMDILKKRPPPKRCGHKNKLPATPPDFWDPMCD